MYNSFSDYSKYKKKLLLSYYKTILAELESENSLQVFNFITDGRFFTFTQTCLGLYFVVKAYKTPKAFSFSSKLISMKPFMLKFLAVSFINMQFFYRSHLQEYPFRNEKDLNRLKRVLIFTTGPSFCIIKDINIIKLISLIRRLNPIQQTKEFKNKTIYTIKIT